MENELDNTEAINENEKEMFKSGSPKINNPEGWNFKGSEQEKLDSAEIVNTEGVYSSPVLAKVQTEVINKIDVTSIKKLNNEEDLRKYIEPLLDEICESEFPKLTKREKILLVQSLIDEFTGFGPIQKLIMDDSISEIMINGAEQVYIESHGKLILNEVKFRDNQHVIQIVDKIVSPLGRRIDESSPMVDARLPNGSRVNAVIPPISLKGPSVTIRKFASKPLTMEDLISNGTLSPEMGNFLRLAVLGKSNIIVAGGTGSGKTTFLNVLSSFISETERIITIEDAAELHLLQPHVVSLEARPANIENKGEVTIRDLVKNSLRMRPDRIIIGEVRGAEALDMLQAMNTGHDGSISTVHANSSRDALSRIETMVLYTGIDFPLKAIREQICSAIDIVVYMERQSDGNRKVIQITEVLGVEGEIISLQDIYCFEKDGKSNGKVRGEFKSTSVRPKLFDKLIALGIS